MNKNMTSLKKRIASNETFTIADNNDISTNITIQTIILQENDMPDIVEYTELKLLPAPVPPPPPPQRKHSVDVFVDYKQAELVDAEYEISIAPPAAAEAPAETPFQVSEALAACLDGLRNCGGSVEWQVSGRGKKVSVNVKWNGGGKRSGRRSSLMRRRFGKKSFRKCADRNGSRCCF